jgi:phosphonate transport system substrate-binding protein
MLLNRSTLEKKPVIRHYSKIGSLSFVLLTALVFQAKIAPADQDHDHHLSFGVFPYLPTKKMEQVFSPIAARFSELTGSPVVLRSRPDFERFSEQLRQQTYDIVFIQPFDYVRIAANNNYLPLARWVASDAEDDRGNLRAIIVARLDSDIASIHDLRGRTVTVPHLEAAVSLLGRHALEENQLEAKIQAAGNHLACLQRVQVRRAAACITARPPAKLFEKKHRTRLKLIYETRMIPSSLFAVHKRVPAKQRKLLKNELLSWRIDDPAQKAYLSRGAWTRMYPASDADYDIVREIWSKISSSEH